MESRLLYCGSTTLSLKVVYLYPSIVENIHDIFVSEGCQLQNFSPFYADELFAINGDKLESCRVSIAGMGQCALKKSVDIIVGVNSPKFGQQLLLIELKLRSVEPFYRLDKFSFRDKVNSSIIALDSSIPVHRKFYIVFSDFEIEQAKRFLFRQRPFLGSDFKAVNTAELYKLFFYRD